MEVTIRKENEMWVAHHDNQTYPLQPASRSLLLLVQAIHNTHPGSTVLISEQISNNPYLANHLVHRRWFRQLPDYELVQVYLDHPDVRVCDHCECEAWFNDVVNTYQCTGCNRVNHVSDPRRFFKLSRWAKWQGGNAHRTKEATLAIIQKKKEVRDRKELEYVEKLKVKYNLVEKQ